MFVPIWATLLFSVRCRSAGTGSFPGGKENCQQGSYSITLSKGKVTAEARLCVVIPCSFTTDPGFIPQHIVWYKCEPSEPKCGDSDIIFNINNTNKVQSGFKGRVSLLEPDVNQGNCSIIINDLTESDSGSYQLRVNGFLDGREDGFTFSARAKVSVKGLTQRPTVMITPLTKGQQTTLTCTAPGLCSGSVPEITWTWRGAGETDSHITGNITAFKTEDLTAVTQRHSSTLTFNSSAKHHDTNVTCKVSFANSISTEETVTLNVNLKGNTATEKMTTPDMTTVTTPASTGNTTVEEGGALNLTCSIKSSHPSALTWTKHGSNKTLQKETTIAPQNNTGTAALVIINVTAEYSGLYICTAQHQTSLTTDSEVNVIFLPTILSSSACVVRLEVLTHVCISEGFPLPTAEWPLLETLTEYSLTTNVSNHTVNISITVFVKHHNDTTVKCVSNNDATNLTIKTVVLNQEDLLKIFLMAFKMPQVIIAFLIGILLSATICCLARKCDRNKQKNSAETLEMMTIQAVPLINAGHAGEYGGAHDQEAAEGGASAPDSNVEPREVEYSAIDFSLLNRTSSRGADDTQGTTETEYAEIKNKVTEESQDSGGEEGEMLEGNEEKEVMTEEEKETEQCVSAVEEGGEDVAVYSNVNEKMGEM
uniref:sialic acid-binding Ig-like lectin 14 n=1 Tax=Epinephelus lanceolatus TaxID=310571 RepID=UPI0014460A00|nr:sialic acid-binding Ig-like lectin 14 [Epinephelus lanceolatus]